MPPSANVGGAWEKGAKSERLILRPLQERDIAPWIALHTDPETTRHTGLNDMTPADAWRDLAFVMGHAQLRGFSMWAIVDRHDGTFLGRVGPWMPDGWPGLEVGWALTAAARGRGIAFEAADLALNWCAAHLAGVRLVVHSIMPNNAASKALVEKLGALLLGQANIGEAVHDSWGSDLDARR
ncbi:MAG: GNAT family N-acetyltransferase [Sphingomonadales bacterium]